jgi:ABC-2 type transport system permease protein
MAELAIEVRGLRKSLGEKEAVAGSTWRSRLGLLAAVIIMLGWLWVRSLGRALVTADTSTGSSRLRRTPLPLARYGLRGTVAARSR